LVKFNYNYARELCRIRLNDDLGNLGTDFYFFFGYSAPMTKVISTFIAKNMQLYLKVLESDKATERTVLLLYNDSSRIGSSGNANENRIIYDWPVTKRWDSNDVINHSNLLSTGKISRASPGWYELLWKNDEKFVLIHSPANEDLFKMINKSAFGHNSLYDNSMNLMS